MLLRWVYVHFKYESCLLSHHRQPNRKQKHRNNIEPFNVDLIVPVPFFFAIIFCLLMANYCHQVVWTGSSPSQWIPLSPSLKWRQSSWKDLGKSHLYYNSSLLHFSTDTLTIHFPSALAGTKLLTPISKVKLLHERGWSQVEWLTLIHLHIFTVLKGWGNLVSVPWVSVPFFFRSMIQICAIHF